MNTNRDDVTRLLRQVAELGGPDLYLEATTAAGLRDIIAGRSTRGTQPAALTTEDHSANVAAPEPASPATLRTLEVLSAGAAACTRCRLHASRTQVVFGEGHANADVAIVGEAPGRDEDRTGRPFVGRAGKLLDLLLLCVGFPRENVYICNVLKCRPPENRNPLPDEMDPCATHHLHAQLAAVAPRVILTVGRFAIQALLGTDVAVGRLRGRIHTYRDTPTIVSYHPAYLLRSPNMVPAVWDDLQLLRTVLDEQT